MRDTTTHELDRMEEEYNREPNDRLPMFQPIPVWDMLKIIVVFLLFFVPCLGLIAWVAQFGG